MPQTYTVENDYHNSRFDRWFKAKIINLPQSLVEKIIRLNKVKINRKRAIKYDYYDYYNYYDYFDYYNYYEY